mgnify:CR=1 FL=1
MVVLIILGWAPEIIHNYRDHKFSDDYFFEVHSVNVGNSVHGEPVILSVDRQVNHQFFGKYNVEVRSFPDRTTICTGSGESTYLPTAKLPEPLTLEWWAFSEDCKGGTLPVGDYIIHTSWTVNREPYGLPDVLITIESNPFTIAEVSPSEARKAINQIQKLEEEIQELRSVD